MFGSQLHNNRTTWEAVEATLRKMEEGRRLGVPAAEGQLDIMRIAFEDEAPDLEAVVRGLL